jgi:hypothetical protein
MVDGKRIGSQRSGDRISKRDDIYQLIRYTTHSIAHVFSNLSCKDTFVRASVDRVRKVLFIAFFIREYGCAIL